MVWAVFGMFMGVWVAAQLAWPSLAFDAAWSSFGRLRPMHTSGVIFGFGGNALIATSFHVVQRTSRARLAGQVSPWFVLLGFNLFCVLAVSGYLLGVTQSKASRHLRYLHAAGLVEDRREGLWVHYRVTQRPSAEQRIVLDAVRALLSDERVATLEARYERRVAEKPLCQVARRAS